MTIVLVAVGFDVMVGVTDRPLEWTPTFEGTPAIIQEMMSADI